MVLLGWSAGLNRAHLRHIGTMPNGNDSLYPGYTDDGAPYIVKHRVSDRHNERPPSEITKPVLRLSDADKARHIEQVGRV